MKKTKTVGCMNRRELLKSAAGAIAAPAVLGLALNASGCKTAARHHSASFPKPVAKDLRKYEELSPEEFYEQLKRAPIGYLPIGAMEEHGLQNVLAVDPWTAYEICLRTASRTGGIVHPIIPIAPAGHPAWSRDELRKGEKDTCPPSVWVSREVCKQLYIELLEMFADLGFKYTIAFSGHFPGDFMLSQIYEEYQGTIRGMKFWGGGTISLLKPELEKHDQEHPTWCGHGMMWETSLVRAINPNWTDLSRVDAIRSSPISHQLKDQPVENLNAIKLANAEHGDYFLDAAADRLAKMAQEALKSS